MFVLFRLRFVHLRISRFSIKISADCAIVPDRNQSAESTVESKDEFVKQ